jgi:hypothetical protein
MVLFGMSRSQATTGGTGTEDPTRQP